MYIGHVEEKKPFILFRPFIFLASSFWKGAALFGKGLGYVLNFIVNLLMLIAGGAIGAAIGVGIGVGLVKLIGSVVSAAAIAMTSTVIGMGAMLLFVGIGCLVAKKEQSTTTNLFLVGLGLIFTGGFSLLCCLNIINLSSQIGLIVSSAMAGSAGLVVGLNVAWQNFCGCVKQWCGLGSESDVQYEMLNGEMIQAQKKDDGCAAKVALGERSGLPLPPPPVSQVNITDQLGSKVDGQGVSEVETKPKTEPIGQTVSFFEKGASPDSTTGDSGKPNHSAPLSTESNPFDFDWSSAQGNSLVSQ